MNRDHFFKAGAILYDVVYLECFLQSRSSGDAISAYWRKLNSQFCITHSMKLVHRLKLMLMY